MEGVTRVGIHFVVRSAQRERLKQTLATLSLSLSEQRLWRVCGRFPSLFHPFLSSSFLPSVRPSILPPSYLFLFISCFCLLVFFFFSFFLSFLSFFLSYCVHIYIYICLCCKVFCTLCFSFICVGESVLDSLSLIQDSIAGIGLGPLSVLHVICRLPRF